jgi:hypothetical protein
VAADAAEDNLAWEARQRRSATIAAATAALGIFVGTVWRGLTLSDLPRHGLLETLARAEEPGPIGTMQSLRISTLEYYDERATGVLLSSVLVAIGYIALGWALTYLAVAVRSRRPEFPKLIVYLPLVAGSLQGLSTVLAAFGTNTAIGNFLDGPRTVDAAADITANGVTVFASLVGLPGALGLALALVFVALNAMRVGLLTRFMGVLGIITGVLIFIPLGSLPVIQAFWLGALGALLLGTWPGGVPAAWTTGRAEIVPSGAEVRRQRMEEARAAKAEPKRRPRADDDEDAAPPAVRRKRKRRN